MLAVYAPNNRVPHNQQFPLHGGCALWDTLRVISSPAAPTPKLCLFLQQMDLAPVTHELAEEQGAWHTSGTRTAGEK
ncbi:hypothetical protein SKAU_G00335230 [Synaphobranchus kaupii]|uniref:Uncharacterized protein n=1 Tax=Synaphobranchus kaupii TaxID=118154 RepID=A0A9Q1ELZ3_SYNKA|nr:hypothetical protein SKAU_G00335230 [Synaphobranchus kaupii]